jgi:hypothetical protein
MKESHVESSNKEKQEQGKKGGIASDLARILVPESSVVACNLLYYTPIRYWVGLAIIIGRETGRRLDESTTGLKADGSGA